MGESTSDFLVKLIHPEAAVSIGFVWLVIALMIQLAARTYQPWKYWFAVVMVAVFGTMIADVLHVQFGISYIVTTAFFSVALIAVFLIWHHGEQTLSIHTIANPRRELFYWATVIVTFALGTATGDMTATTFHIGYFWSGVLFAGLIMVPWVAWRFLAVNAVATFWFAYIITRPLGASFADWTGKSTLVGGLGLGDRTVSLVLTTIIVLVVAYLGLSGVGRDPSQYPGPHVSGTGPDGPTQRDGQS